MYRAADGDPDDSDSPLDRTGTLVGVSQGDTKVLVMTEERRGKRERDVMKDAVRQAEGQRRERVEDWEKNSSAMENENKETMWSCPVTLHLEVKQRSEIRQRLGQRDCNTDN